MTWVSLSLPLLKLLGLLTVPMSTSVPVKPKRLGFPQHSEPCIMAALGGLSSDEVPSSHHSTGASAMEDDNEDDTPTIK
jgi:hypothetical protein